MSSSEQGTGAEPVQGSTEVPEFIEAVGPWPEAPDTGVADQTPTPDVDDPELRDEIHDVMADDDQDEVSA